MMDIRLIALDLDGTVFDDEKRISPRTLAALRAALDRGVIVLPATGRTLDGVPDAFRTMPGVRYALVSNGASVMDLQTGEQLVCQCFAPQTARDLYFLTEPMGGMQCLFVAGDSFTTEANARDNMDLVPPALQPYFRKSRKVVPSMDQVLDRWPDKVEKFSTLYRSVKDRDAVWQAVAQRFPEVEITTSIEKNLELNAPGVNKGTGLMMLARRLGLRPDQVMACGDSGNDLEMIRRAGLGVAMGNSTRPVLEAADYVTLDNNHDGVAAAIEKFVL